VNVLVIAAHPDDEVLGCGGTIARLAREGHEVFVVILGEGITSRYSDRQSADATLVSDLQDKSRQVAKLLGARECFLEGLPDNRFDTLPLLSVVKRIEGYIERLRPNAVYTQHGGDLNVDHSITFRATLTATRPVCGSCVRSVYAYEVASSTEWAFQQIVPVFQPNVFMDISDTIEAKLEAMKLYEGEMRAFPHPRSSEALRSIAGRWGSVAGLQAAEAFQCIRVIR